MTIKERIALARAGYSKKEIEKLAQDEANEPKQEEPKQEETAETKQEEAKQIAGSFTDPAQGGENIPAWAQHLLDRFTANEILMSNQPPEETTETICAKIIEPFNSFDPNK